MTNIELENQKAGTLKTHRLIIIEWITTIAVFVSCFAYLSYKIEKQSDRTDKLYEMFFSLQKQTHDMFFAQQKETKDMFIDLLKEKKL